MTKDEKEFFKIKKEYDMHLKNLKKKKEKQLVKLDEIKNNKKIWITDKNGYKICKLLIEPTIEQLVFILKKKLKNKNNSKIKIKNLEEEMKFYQTIHAILESIDTKKLKNDINKYIAPNFNLDKK
jgi:hypothetical protein